jgi:hypothetical protein
MSDEHFLIFIMCVAAVGVVSYMIRECDYGSN